MSETPEPRAPRFLFARVALAKIIMKAAGMNYASYSTMSEAFAKWTMGAPTHSGKSVDPDSAMKVSAAWACIRILAETIGALPWALYERTSGDNAQRADNHPVAQLLQQPNADMTSVEFKEALVTNLCRAGNGYAQIERGGAQRIASLYPYLSERVTPKRRESGEVYYLIRNARGQQIEVERSAVWHIKGFGTDGLIGLSPIGAAREALGMSLATEDFGAKFFSQGGMPGGIVTVDKFLTKDQRVIARENLQQIMGGLGNAHRFALFEGGMKPTAWGNMPLEDMQFILLRKFSIQEICRFYRIPPHMVADLDRATFSNIEHLSQEFVMFTLMPYLTRIEAAVSRWLLLPAERGKYFVRFNYEGLLRADSAGRASFYKELVLNGIMNRNEVRAKENLNASTEEGMNAFTVQSQMISIADMGKVAMPGAAPPFLDRRVPAKTAVDFPEPLVPAPESPFSLELPKSLTADMRYLVDHPAVKSLIERVQQSEERTRRRAEDIKRDMGALVGEMEKSMQRNMEQVVAAASRPRKLVTDEEGNPIGTVAVDALELN